MVTVVSSTSPKSVRDSTLLRRRLPFLIPLNAHNALGPRRKDKGPSDIERSSQAVKSPPETVEDICHVIKMVWSYNEIQNHWAGGCYPPYIRRQRAETVALH